MKTFMKTSAICVLAAVAPLTVTGAAHALSAISARFDGRYMAQTEVASRISTGAACDEFSMPQLTISKGMISTPRSDLAKANGFITAEGFVQASLTSPAGGKIDISGRYVNGEIVAGAMDNTTGCAWIVHLHQ